MAKTTVLIIEDDRSLAEVVTYNLQREGYEVYVAHDGEDGLTQARLKLPDVIILDLMLPVLDGLEACRRLRADSATKNTRILMLTAKAEESDQLIGFALGADDYVTKPFSVKVLLERVKSLCRRDNESAAVQLIASQGVAIDPVRYRVTVNEDVVNLTRSEFRLLECLLRQPGRVFSRSELIDVALGEDTLVLERTIDVHVRSLRKKLDTHADVVQTVRGVGYKFRDPSDQRVSERV
ncbi:response regulator [Novipirellula sp. SH528]|uniref:response regulator n=1 Tax=Novipirellula sp. SH528 TaxID=3454466 RepID=UPI003FA0CE69|tara:strand:+ start:362 stop:1072 length:711 start_codon:yes stop_codon:yes gene_type:complete